jgi:hypothetical protein
LTQLSGSPFPDGNPPEWAAVTPDGKHLYVPNSAGNVSAYTIGVDGGLTQVTGSPFAAGAFATGIAITPDQGPTAAFSTTAAPAGSTTSFDGSASRDTDGTVVRYDWNFGDGTVASNAGPMPKHSYSAAGSYTVTLIVTDDVGCSTAQVFTGQMALCNGGPAARMSQTVVVPPPAISKLHVSPRRFAATGRKVNGQCVKPTKSNSGKPACRRRLTLAISYTLDAPATVTFRLKVVASGRKVKGRCVKPTAQNRKQKPCTRLTSVRGKFGQDAHSGSNRFTLRGSAEGPGTYELIATPGASGQPQSVRFKILP